MRFRHIGIRWSACINRDQRDGKRVRLLREFVRDFRGLTGSAKLAAALDELGLSRVRLDVFSVDDKVDHGGIARLLAAMRQHSKPVKPERLGLIGRERSRGSRTYRRQRWSWSST